uniref:Methionine aminopeptidase n=1 Tax=Ursus americanus TaxID=9643 RepID=A0A452QUH7_URSAM
MTTEEIDALVHQEIISHDAYPSPLGYGGFPKSVCTSVNNVLCHGIPDSRPLQDGDIINIDVTVYYNGYHGDTSETFLVGNVDECGKKLVEVARRCRDEAIAACRAGAPFSVIGNTISHITHQNGLHVCPHFVGHGIGSYFHGHPEIWHHANDSDLLMEEGMAFTIEPIITEGSPEFKVLEDAWTVVSLDKQRCLLSVPLLLNDMGREGWSDGSPSCCSPPRRRSRAFLPPPCVFQVRPVRAHSSHHVGGRADPDQTAPRGLRSRP